MNWPTEKQHKYYIESDVGYTISKSFLHGEPAYTAWAPVPKNLEVGVKYTFIKIVPALNEAKDLCEEHYAKKTATASSGGLAVAHDDNNGAERESR